MALTLVSFKGQWLPYGRASGPGLLPLYARLPLAACADPALYELLALFDALRAGQTRVRGLATMLIEKRLPNDGAQQKSQERTAGMLSIGGQLQISRDELEALAKHYHIRRLSVFGSAARGALGPASDVDLLVEFVSGKAPSLGGMLEIKDAFSRLFGGRPVDLATTSILENPYRRRAIERDMEMLYAS